MISQYPLCTIDAYYAGGDIGIFAKDRVVGASLTLTDTFPAASGAEVEVRVGGAAPVTLSAGAPAAVVVQRQIELKTPNATECYLKLLELAAAEGHTLAELSQIPLKLHNIGSLNYRLVYPNTNGFTPGQLKQAKPVIGGYIHNKLNIEVIIAGIYLLLMLLDPSASLSLDEEFTIEEKYMLDQRAGGAD